MRDMLAPTSFVSSRRYPCLANMVFHSLRVRQPPPGHIARISIENSPARTPSSCEPAGSVALHRQVNLGHNSQAAAGRTWAAR